MAPIVMPAAQHLISYHLVTTGACWIVPRKGESVQLNAGDVIVIPGGIRMSSAPTQKCHAERRWVCAESSRQSSGHIGLSARGAGLKGSAWSVVSLAATY